MKGAGDAARIAELNDQLRKEGEGGWRLIMPDVQTIDGYDPEELLDQLAAYDDFKRWNDHLGERDFGKFDYHGVSVVWTIDYFAPSLDREASNPADPDNTIRIMTIMRREVWRCLDT